MKRKACWSLKRDEDTEQEEHPGCKSNECSWSCVRVFSLWRQTGSYIWREREREWTFTGGPAERWNRGRRFGCGAAYAFIVSFMSKWFNDLIHRAVMPVNLMIICETWSQAVAMQLGDWLWKQRSQVAHQEDGFWHETYWNVKYSQYHKCTKPQLWTANTHLQMALWLGLPPFHILSPVKENDKEIWHLRWLKAELSSRILWSTNLSFARSWAKCIVAWCCFCELSTRGDKSNFDKICCRLTTLAEWFLNLFDAACIALWFCVATPFKMMANLQHDVVWPALAYLEVDVPRCS